MNPCRQIIIEAGASRVLDSKRSLEPDGRADGFVIVEDTVVVFIKAVIPDCTVI